MTSTHKDEMTVSSSVTCIQGNGEMARLIRAFDWAKTSIGAIEAWPATLVTIVNMMLQSPVPLVLLWGLDGIMLYNDPYSGFAGGRHPFLLGSKVLEGWPEVADFNRNVMEQGFQGKTLSFKDQRLTLYRNSMAEDVWMDLNYSPILDESGHPAGVLAIVVETTERVKAELCVRESEARFKSMSDTAPVMIWMSDTNGSIIYRNTAFAAFQGLDHSSSEIIEWEPLIHPEEIGWVKQIFYEAAQSKKPFMMPEHRLKRYDGEYRWIIANGAPRLAPDGVFMGFIGSVLDITERKQIEDSLKESEAKFRRLVESNMIGILFWNLDGQILSETNDAFLEMIGYSRTELNEDKVNWWQLTPPESVEITNKSIQELFKSSCFKPIERQFFHKDGSRVDVLMAGAFLDGSQEKGVCYVLDITDRKQAESVLKESQERFQAIADESPVFIFMMGENAKVEFWNKTYLEFTGLSYEAALNWTWEAVVHPEDLALTLEVYNQAFQERKPYRIECRFKNKEGEYRWILWTGTPRHLPNGEFVCYMGTGMDIHHRRTIEEALKESETRFRTMADTAPLFVWTSGPDCRTNFINKTWRDFLGALPESAAEAMQLAMSPEEQANASKLYRAAFAKREPYTMEYRFRRFDGQFRWLLTKGCPLLLPSGQLAGYIGTSIDITDEKELQNQLETNLAHERLIRKISQVINQSFDIELILKTVTEEIGKYLDADRCSVNRFSVLNGKLMLNLSANYTKEGCLPVTPDDIKLITEAVQQIDLEALKRDMDRDREQIINISNQEEYLEHLRMRVTQTIPDGLPGLPTEQFIDIVRKYGIQSTLRVNIQYRGRQYGSINISQCSYNRVWSQDEIELLKTIAEHAGSAIYQAELYQNAKDTAEKELNARQEMELYAKRLETSNKELEQFATIASHDLSEPLRKIHVLTEMLESKIPLEEKDYFNRIVSAAKRMRILMDDLLTFSRVNRATQPFRPINLNITVQTVLDDLQVAITESQADIQVDSLATIVGDESQMRQLFQNLISNAIKYRRTDVPTLISIRGRQDSDCHVICIEDNGIGIPEEYYERIFEPFQRLHGMGKYPGTGMGLAICRKIVERHQGTLTVSSQENKGSQFILNFPAPSHSILREHFSHLSE